MIKKVENSNEDTSEQVDELVLPGKNVSTAMEELTTGTVEQASDMDMITEKFSLLEKSFDSMDKNTETMRFNKNLNSQLR